MTSTPSLLLLPAPPSPSDRVSLSAAYRPSITAIFNKIHSHHQSQESPLVIALACPTLKGASNKNKTLCWKTAQSLLAGIYSVIAVIAAQEGITADVRVVLVDHVRGKTYHKNFDGEYESNNTPILDLAAFAAKVKPWKTVYHTSCETGYDLLSTFLQLAEGKQLFKQEQLVVVEGGLSIITEEAPAREDIEGYDSVCLGGTFDHIHPGHKLLLHATVLLLNIPDKDSDKTCELIVGITGPELLVNKRYAEELESWDTRAQSVISFLSTLLEYDTTTPATFETSQTDEKIAHLRSGRVKVRCVNIHDPFGPPIAEEGVKAICLSGETRKGGFAINEKRRERGWKDLEIYEIDVLAAKDVAAADEEGQKAAENFEDKISSTAIRRQRAEARAAARQ